jgi:hypothetical protein
MVEMFPQYSISEFYTEQFLDLFKRNNLHVFGGVFDLVLSVCALIKRHFFSTPDFSGLF